MSLWPGIRAMALGAICLLVAAVAVAGEEEFGDELALVGEVEPVGEATLAAARGGASLPGGLGIEVTALMRVLADGEELISMTGGLGAAAHGYAAQDLVLQGQNLPTGGQVLDNPMIVNALDNIALEQYREITIHLQNVPRTGGIVPVAPAVTIPGIPRLYVY